MRYYAAFTNLGRLISVTVTSSATIPNAGDRSVHQVTEEWMNHYNVGDLCEPAPHGVGSGQISTPAQQKLLTFIKKFLNKNGYSPSVAEMMKGMGHKSLSTTHDMIGRLVSAGWLTREPGVARGIRVVG